MEGFQLENTQSLQTNIYTQPSPFSNSFTLNHNATPTPAGKRGRDWSPDGAGADKAKESKRGKTDNKENAKPTGGGGGGGGRKSKKKEAEQETKKKGDHWTPEEITCLVNAIYGPDNEYIYETSKTHPTKAFKLVSVYMLAIKPRSPLTFSVGN